MNISKFVRRICVVLALLLVMPVFATASKVTVCEIVGNNCQEVVNLLYEIFMVPGNGYKLDFSNNSSKLTIHEPYAAQLKEMGIKVKHFSRMRDGGTTYVYLADGTEVYFDNNISHGTLEDPTVTFSNGKKFSLQWPAPKEKACQIAGYDCEDVADYLAEIFMGPNTQGEYNYHLDSSNEPAKPVIHEPYAASLKKMGIEVENLSRESDGDSVYIHLTDGTVVYLDKNLTNPAVTLADGKEFSFQW